MPVYTYTTTTSTLTPDIKGALAQEISRIHAEINHVPSTYVNVIFHELPHPADKTTRLATEIAAAVSRIADIDADRVLMVIQDSPASGAIEGGRVLPEPGQEEAWLAGR